MSVPAFSTHIIITNSSSVHLLVIENFLYSYCRTKENPILLFFRTFWNFVKTNQSQVID